MRWRPPDWADDGAPVKVLIASPLRSYTGADEVEARGATLGELLADLDRRYPGIRFRMIDEQDSIRRHIRFFVNGEQVFDLAAAPCGRPTRWHRAGAQRRISWAGSHAGRSRRLAAGYNRKPALSVAPTAAPQV